MEGETDDDTLEDGDDETDVLGDTEEDGEWDTEEEAEPADPPASKNETIQAVNAEPELGETDHVEE